jgi:hypothetical protein
LSTPSIDSRGGGEIGDGIEGAKPNRSSMRRRSSSRSSLRAPASTSISTGSVTISGPSPAISSAMRWSAVLPVPRSYSTHAEYRPGSRGARPGIGRHLAHRVRTLHRQRLLARHRLARQMPQRKVNGLGLGVDPVAALIAST